MAKVPHRITYELLSDDVKSIIQSGLIVFDVNYDYIFSNQNPDGYDYVRVDNGEHKNEIYFWNEGFKLFGMAEHNHDDRYHTKAQIIDEYYNKTTINDKLYLKADKEVVIGSVKPTNENMWYKEI